MTDTADHESEARKGLNGRGLDPSEYVPSASSMVVSLWQPRRRLACGLLLSTGPG
jgi:hypothetical protein